MGSNEKVVLKGEILTVCANTVPLLKAQMILMPVAAYEP